MNLANDPRVCIATPADRRHIAVGKFIGATSIELGSRRVAREMHVVDNSLRGLGDGHYPWDLLTELNMMTNADVADVAAALGGGVVGEGVKPPM